MKRVNDIKEIQSIELEILKCLDKFCRENNINYYLIAGTLLGSIRHRGFIPWDDDVDICMPRPDYNKFVKKMKKFKSKSYSLKCIENGKKKYNYCFGKMIDNNTIVKEEGKFEGEEIGVWVDIFPLDGLGNDIEEAKKIIAKNKRYVLQILNLEAGKKMNIKGRILYYLGRKNLNRLLKHNMMKNDFYSSKYVTAIGCVEPSTIYNGQSFRGIRKGIFEGNEFIIPKNSEDVLKTLYGDYMSFPPKEMRKPSHKIKVWIK